MRMREMRTKKYKLLLMWFIMTTSNLVGYENPTAPEHLKSYAGDFTDTDDDGMTDYAELKYGFDPTDNTSNSSTGGKFYSTLLSDNSSFNPSSVGLNSYRKFFKFSDVGLTESNKVLYKEFLVKVIPLLYHILGTPHYNHVCRIKRSTQSDVYSISGGGRTITLGKNWRPSSFVHEIVHSWRSSLYGNGLTRAWEEGFASGASSLIVNEYLLCYPNDVFSKSMLKKRGKLGNSAYLYSSVESLYDISKYQRNLVGWKQAEETWEYYTHSGSFFKILAMSDSEFIKKFNKSYITQVRSNSPKGYDTALNVISKISKTINGIDTREFIESTTLHSKSSSPEDGFHSVLMRRGYIDYTPYVSPRFAKNGKFDWYTFDKEFNDVPTYTKPNGQIVADLRDQPFQIDILDASDVRHGMIHGQSSDKSNNDGSPHTDPKVAVPELNPKNLEQGLYIAQISFTNFTHSTENFSDDYYIFGRKNLIQKIQNNFTLMVGIDSDPLVNTYMESCKVKIDGKYYSAPLINNSAFFEINDIPHNFSGHILIEFSGPNVPHEFSGVKENFVTRTYKRTLVNGGSTCANRHHCFLVIDEDFDGIEDAHDGNILNLSDEFNALMDSFIADDSVSTNAEFSSGLVETVESTNTKHTTEHGLSETTDTSSSDVTTIIQVETNNSVVIVSNVNDAFIDYSNNAIIDTDSNTIVIENVTSVTAFDGTLQSTTDDNVVIVEQETISLYANDSTTHEITAEDSLVTITDTEIFVDANEVEKTERIIADKIAPPSPPVVVNAWETCTPVESNWYHTDWFGYFFKMPNNGWIYHEILGWLYVDFASTFDSFWIYHEILGWHWSSREFFPYMYNSQSDSWVYLADGHHYDFSSSTWLVTR